MQAYLMLASLLNVGKPAYLREARIYENIRVSEAMQSRAAFDPHLVPVKSRMEDWLWGLSTKEAIHGGSSIRTMDGPSGKVPTVT